MKNVFVQCELWCDEILRRVARPCCTCSRHVSAQALEDLAPAQRLQISPCSSRALAPGFEISLTQCPTRQARVGKRSEKSPKPCPGKDPTEGCQKATTSYPMYSTIYKRHRRITQSPFRFSSRNPSESFQSPVTPSTAPLSRSSSFSPIRSRLYRFQSDNIQTLQIRDNQASIELQNQQNISNTFSPNSYFTAHATNSGTSRDMTMPFCQTPMTIFDNVRTQEENLQTQQKLQIDKAPRKIKKIEYNSRKFSMTLDISY